jgi:hypothetical protein
MKVLHRIQELPYSWKGDSNDCDDWYYVLTAAAQSTADAAFQWQPKPAQPAEHRNATLNVSVNVQLCTTTSLQSQSSPSAPCTALLPFVHPPGLLDMSSRYACQKTQHQVACMRCCIIFLNQYHSSWPSFSCRNITITGIPGLDPVPQLDFQFKLSVIELCNSCWLTMYNITVKDERLVSSSGKEVF